jgi:glutathione S-transferase
MSATALSWEQLAALAAPELDRVNGPCNAQAQLRLFGQPEEAVRVTLYRDHHAWCPYCQKVWLWLEERRIPYRIRKVTMMCYGDKEPWYRQLVPSGMLPALELDGRLITESDRILEALEQNFGPLGSYLNDPQLLPLRQLERQLFRAWCQWLCSPSAGADDSRPRHQFRQRANAVEQALAAGGGPFFPGAELGTADLIFVPFMERMNASLAYYKGYLLRREHPAIERWFAALERRPSYLGSQSDFHTHAHDLPPQLGGCQASGGSEQQNLAARIDRGPWPIAAAGQADPETSQPEPADAALVAIQRLVKHRGPLLARQPQAMESFDLALRCALTLLATGTPLAPPAGTAAALRALRDRISVPRDMPLHAARKLRQALESTALLDPTDPGASGPPIPSQHRRDQDRQAFLAAARSGALAGAPAGTIWG